MSDRTRKQSRLKRKRPAPIELTDRDAEIFLALHKYRFLTTEHIQVLTQTESKWSMNKRLRLLYDHKYLDRPKAQRAIFSHAAKRPTVHALGNEGARLLSQRYNIPMPSSVYWTEKNRRVREKFIEHTLGISDFMVAMEDACRVAGNVRIIDPDQILVQSPTQTKHAKYPFRWKTQIRADSRLHDIAIVPDYVFGLEYLDKPDGKNKAFFFVEVDRGTMPIVRRDIQQTSFLRKMQSYSDTWRRKLALRRFGIKSFRVLTLTTSDDRIKTMTEAFRTEMTDSVPSGVFLFLEREKATQGQLTWQTASGKPVTLI